MERQGSAAVTDPLYPKHATAPIDKLDLNCGHCGMKDPRCGERLTLGRCEIIVCSQADPCGAVPFQPSAFERQRVVSEFTAAGGDLVEGPHQAPYHAMHGRSPPRRLS